MSYPRSINQRIRAMHPMIQVFGLINYRNRDENVTSSRAFACQLCLLLIRRRREWVGGDDIIVRSCPDNMVQERN
jgi:hypothetical protein